jgi:hypothetical protein
MDDTTETEVDVGLIEEPRWWVESICEAIESVFGRIDEIDPADIDKAIADMVEMGITDSPIEIFSHGLALQYLRQRKLMLLMAKMMPPTEQVV